MARRREPVPLTAFARELRAFAERHGKSGRGVQTWLRSLGIGEHRGPVSSWWNGYSVPADNAAVYLRRAKISQEDRERLELDPLPARRCTACGDLDDTQREQLAALVHDMIAGGWDDTVPLLAQMARTVAAIKGGAPLPARAAL